MGTRAEGWGRDLRLAARSLRRTPGFALIAAGTLGLAIGANAGIFTVVDTVLLRPLPYENVDRLVFVAASAPGTDQPGEFEIGDEFIVHYGERSRLVESMSLAHSFTSTLRVGERVERVRMSVPTWSLYDTLGVQPMLGRAPTADEEESAVVISHALWREWFGADPNVLGRTLEASGETLTILGVMPPSFRFPDDGTLLWMSLHMTAADVDGTGRHWTYLVARTKPGVTPAALADELTGLARELPQRFGGTPAYARLIEKHRAVVRPLREQMLGASTRPLLVLLAAVGIVLLVACANVANLFLVRAEGRQRDLALRRAIGAARSQLFRLQMAEALVVAGLAALLSLGVAAALLPLVLRFAPEVPRLDLVPRFALSPASLLFTLVAALVAAGICGAVPALRSSRAEFARLREGGRGSTAGRRWARQLLVAAQTALALVLLAGSGLLLRSFQELSRVDPGYETADRFTFQFAPQRESLRDPDALARFQLDALERFARLPGVRSAGLVDNIPLNESTRSERLFAEGRAGSTDEGTLLHLTFTAGDYFPTMGIALEEGRLFATEDHLSHAGNVILSRAAAEALWPGASPLGRRLRDDGETWLTVVGVVEDVRQDSFRDRPQALVYLPLTGPATASWAVSSPAFVLLTSRAEAIAPEVRAIVREIAPEAPMYRVYTMAGLARDSMRDLSFTMLMLGLAASLALVLGAVGLYGVLAYAVAQRGREIGVRMALGARAEEVRRMVVGQGARVVAVGLAAGLVVALLATRALRGLLFGVAPWDPPTFLATAAAMLAVGLLASWLPARRASAVDPAITLRAE
jgi:predicted permease